MKTLSPSYILLLLLFSPFSNCYADIDKNNKSISFGIHPYLSAIELNHKFRPIISYLSEETGYDIEIRVSPSYSEHINRITSSDIDFAYLGPSTYVKSRQINNKIRPLARLEVNNSPYFSGVFITNINSDISKITDLAGKSFAFGNINSTMSHIVPKHTLNKLNMFNKLDQTSFLDNHDNVALSILLEKYDAGAVKEGVYLKYKNRGLKKIGETDKISEHLFVCADKTNNEICNKIKSSLLSITRDSKHLDILRNIKPTATAIVNTKYSDYKNLETIMNSNTKK